MLRALSVNRLSGWTMALALLCGRMPYAHCEQPIPAEQLAFFESHVRPLLVKRCYECHSPQSDQFEGGLRLDTRAGIRAGGDSGPAVVPGDIDRSLLMSAIRYDGIEMPPDKQLPDSEIDILQRWIRMGAPDPRDGPAATGSSSIDLARASQFWSFQRVGDPLPPQVKAQDWSNTSIDPFVLNKLEATGLQPAPGASRAELIRRMAFDILGLPPTPDEIDRFVADNSPDAIERLVDRLLASPRYGERWGQHWLDVARFAETEGFEYDRTVLGAWRFRDYIINALSGGMAYDQFLTEQVAGDELPTQNHDTLIAATFHRLGAVRRNAGNQEVAGSRNEVLTERTDIIGSAVLGLTIACARCHDHKFDPISQRDYYSLQAYFAASHENEVPLVSPDDFRRWQQTASATQKKIDGLKKELALQTGAVEAATMRQIEALEKQLPEPVPIISTVRNEFDKQTPIHVLKRGEWSMPGDKAAPNVPAILQQALAAAQVGSAHGPKVDTVADLNSPRQSLARWLTEPTNPLTARVFVNRIWLYHFGRGIVASPNDFGFNGQRPSHPELLDHLARRFIDSGWQIKPLHRLILLSSTYQQSSASPMRQKAIQIDPNNALLWRFTKRRLSAEELRDAMLSVSGQLSLVAGGPSIMLPVEQPLIDQLYNPSQWQVSADPSQNARRSVYLIAKRNLRLPFMEVFDQPTLTVSCARRESSTHAPQALELLNGQISNQLADAFADRLMREAGQDLSRSIEIAYRLVAGREPTAVERQLAAGFLATESRREFTLAMFNLNSFLYVR